MELGPGSICCLYLYLSYPIDTGCGQRQRAAAAPRTSARTSVLGPRAAPPGPAAWSCCVCWRWSRQTLSKLISPVVRHTPQELCHPAFVPARFPRRVCPRHRRTEPHGARSVRSSAAVLLGGDRLAKSNRPAASCVLRGGHHPSPRLVCTRSPASVCRCELRLARAILSPAIVLFGFLRAG